MTQTKFTTLPKENWDSEATIEEKNQCPAADWNQVANEIIDVIEKSGESADTNLQMAQAIIRNALCGDFFTDESTVADKILLGANGTFSPPTEYIDGMKVSFIPLYSNTGPATIRVNELTAKNIYFDANLTDLSGGEIAINKLTELRYNASIDGFILNKTELERATTSSYGTTILNANFINGLIPSSNRTTNNTSIDLTAGKCLCKDGSTILTFSAYTDEDMETTDNTAITILANSTTYHLFGYKKDDDTYNLWLDTTLTPTITSIKSANAYRRIFSFKTDSSGYIIEFLGREKSGGSYEVLYKNGSGILDIQIGTIPTTRTAYALSVPPNMIANVNMLYVGDDEVTSYILITEEGQTDVVPTQNNCTILGANGAYVRLATSFKVNSSSQIYLRGNDDTDDFVLNTLGYNDYRINE